MDNNGFRSIAVRNNGVRHFRTDNIGFILLALRASVNLGNGFNHRQPGRYKLQRFTNHSLTDNFHHGSAFIARFLVFGQINDFLLDQESLKHFLSRGTGFTLFFFFSGNQLWICFIGEFLFLLFVSFQLNFIKEIQLTVRLNHVLFAGATEESPLHGFNFFFCQALPFLTFSQ